MIRRIDIARIHALTALMQRERAAKGPKKQDCKGIAVGKAERKLRQRSVK